MLNRLISAIGMAGLCGAQAGCSIFSPVPLWELAKGAGQAVSLAMPYTGTQASNTVYHLHPAFDAVCIEFNPDAAVPDVLPALQMELRRHQIESRVYDYGPLTAGVLADQCPVWLRYDAYVEWDIPPLSSTWRAYVRTADLTLRRADGQVLSSSQYELAGGIGMGMGKWASTQSKLAPVVTALITGMQN
jgi:hypothetical protein